MPELPEVETIRRDLEPLVVGRTVAEVEVDPGTIDLLTDLPIDALRAGLVGRRFVSLGRRGKYLLFGMDDGRTFVTHLRMTGRLVWRGAGDPAIEYERGRIALDGGHDLRWSDLRKFGTWDIVEDPAEVVGKLGPEPLDEAFTAAFLWVIDVRCRLTAKLGQSAAGRQRTGGCGSDQGAGRTVGALLGRARRRPARCVGGFASRRPHPRGYDE